VISEVMVVSRLPVALHLNGPRARPEPPMAREGLVALVAALTLCENLI
jgi:hypothetical protein